MKGKKLGFEPKVIFSLLPWFYCGCSEKVIGAGGGGRADACILDVLSWRSHDTSKRRVEFGGWGRSNRIQKEFISGSYIVTSACWEHQTGWLSWWNSQTAILAAHLQGCSVVCVWFSRSIFRSCSQGLLSFFLSFFWHVSGPLSSTCAHGAVSSFLKRLCHLLSCGWLLRCASLE